MSLLGNTLLMGIVLLAFYLVPKPIPGMDRIFAGIGQSVGRVTVAVVAWLACLTVDTAFFLVATMVDLVITGFLVAHHAPRLWLIPKDWVAFTTRLNDRAHRTLLAGL